MRIIVTGAAGFIGSVLCRRAAELGHQVVGLDDLSRGLNVVEGVVFAKHDCQGGLLEAQVLYKPGLALDYGRPMRPDAVVHLAAGTGSLDRPYEELVALNVEMTKRVYEDAKALGAKVFVFPTTSLALGVPDSPYVRSKEDAMRWLLEQRSSVQILPLRFFNVLGAYKGCTERRRNEVHIVPRLVRCFKTGEEFTINGDDYETEDGTPSRDFINVLDVVDFILVNADRAVTHGKFHAGTMLQDDRAVWLGTGWLTTAYQVAEVFRQFVGPVKLKKGPRRAFDCGSLLCATMAPASFKAVIGRPLAPAWVGIRDEAQALLDG